MKIVKITFLFILAFCTAAYSQHLKEKISLENFVDYETAGNPQLSPDGMQIIYSRTWINLVDDKRETDLWIMNADGSRNRFFINGSNGKWSPDGSRVAFTRSGEPKGSQIFIKYVDDQGEPTQITKLEESPSNIEWSPDGKYLAFNMHVSEAQEMKADIPAKPDGAKWTAPPTIIDKPQYRRDRIGYLKPGYSHVFVVPADGGKARQVTSGDWNHGSAVAWTPDSKKLIVNSLRIPEADYAYRESNLYAVDLNSESITQLTDRKGSESDASVSPDGQRIAFVGNVWTENFYHKQHMFVMKSDGSDIKMISESLDQTPGSPMWAADNSGVYFNVSEFGNSNLYFASIDGKVKKVTSGNHMLSATTFNDNGIAAGVISTSSNPPDIVKINTKTGEITQLTKINSDILDYITLGEVEEVNYKSNDGTAVQGWLVKPPDFDPTKKYPMILVIHGGPHAMYNVGFNLSFQLHAADGYLVLYTNPRGSTGYGYDFANAIQNAYPGKDYEDLMSGVDEIISRGIVDENRLIVYGGSGGGVLTSWIIGQTDRFAAASVNYPVINWMSFVGTTDGIGWYNNFEKYPWEDPSEHIKRSPLMYVGNVKTPTMLMCGVNDLRTPISQTEEYFQALQVNKVPSVMIRFNEEFHGTSSKPSNYLRTMGYLNSWFEKHAPEQKTVKP